MRFFLFPLVLLGLVSQTIALTNYRACYNKSMYTIQAISYFCSKTDIVVPSQYARTMMFSKVRNSAVKIDGNCRPAQWVPSSICKKQFHQMCARGGKWGSRTARWGRNLCQEWNIYAQSNGAVPGKNGGILAGWGKRDVGEADDAFQEFENKEEWTAEE